MVAAGYSSLVMVWRSGGGVWLVVRVWSGRVAVGTGLGPECWLLEWPVAVLAIGVLIFNFFYEFNFLFGGDESTHVFGQWRGRAGERS